MVFLLSTSITYWAYHPSDQTLSVGEEGDKLGVLALQSEKLGDRDMNSVPSSPSLLPSYNQLATETCPCPLSAKVLPLRLSPRRE